MNTSMNINNQADNTIDSSGAINAAVSSGGSPAEDVCADASKGKREAGRERRKTRQVKPHKHIYDESHTCIICGDKHIASGKIFKGFCVCEDCVEYMCTGDDAKNAQ